jgi:hypothetical protein
VRVRERASERASERKRERGETEKGGGGEGEGIEKRGRVGSARNCMAINIEPQT